jgi:polysaccharide export outer membrane protein
MRCGAVRVLWLGLLALLSLSACAPGHGLKPLPPASRDYRLGPGDGVRLIVYGEDSLTGQFQVGADGAIAVPLLGEVHAVGLTAAELGQEIADLLQGEKLLTHPSVAAEVTAYRPIFVLGEVNKPGEYPYQPGMTVVTAVAVAGGFTYRAIQDDASVVRTIGGHAVEGRATRETYLQPGDVVTIFERRF